MTKPVNLPEMPRLDCDEASAYTPDLDVTPAFAAVDAMRSYGLACYRKALEDAARVCEAQVVIYEHNIRNRDGAAAARAEHYKDAAEYILDLMLREITRLTAELEGAKQAARYEADLARQAMDDLAEPRARYKEDC